MCIPAFHLNCPGFCVFYIDFFKIISVALSLYEKYCWKQNIWYFVFCTERDLGFGGYRQFHSRVYFDEPVVAVSYNV